jgi:hypothetical protein
MSTHQSEGFGPTIRLGFMADFWVLVMTSEIPKSKGNIWKLADAILTRYGFVYIGFRKNTFSFSNIAKGKAIPARGRGGP